MQGGVFPCHPSRMGNNVLLWLCHVIDLNQLAWRSDVTLKKLEALCARSAVLPPYFSWCSTLTLVGSSLARARASKRDVRFFCTMYPMKPLECTPGQGDQSIIQPSIDKCCSHSARMFSLLLSEFMWAVSNLAETWIYPFFVFDM